MLTLCVGYDKQSSTCSSISPKAPTVEKQLPFIQSRHTTDYRHNRTKIVLFWNRPSDWRLKFDKCEYKDCVITNDKNDFPRSDAILFHAPNLRLKDAPKRVPGQIYIYMSHESPENTFTSYKSQKWHNVFNWTWSYRRDADITAPYGAIVSGSNDTSENNFSQIFRSKKKQAAWFVSHCKTVSKREQYVKLMQRYVDVDIYGTCGKFKCPRSINKKCTDILSQNYKYYLSFENSLCRDYITEKALHIVNNLVVPITRGDKYVHMYMPPKSYIDAQDFSSVKKLTDYMLKISANETEYKEYYKWRKFFRPVRGSTRGLCELCRKLHNVENYARRYVDIHAWSSKIEDTPICIKNPKDLI